MFRNVYICEYVYVIINDKECYGFEIEKEEYMRGFEENKNYCRYIIV